MPDYRMLKWVGQPPVLQSDGFRVYNWKYENTRILALEMPIGHKGRARREIPKGNHVCDDTGETIPVSQTYTWDQDKHKHFVVPVTAKDARAILALCPYEFKDVTGLDEREWAAVRNDPIIMPAVQKPGASGRASSPAGTPGSGRL